MRRYRTWIEINERALTHNIDTLRSLLEGDARFCAVVKANAYGHGLHEVAQIAGRAGVDAFAVDHINDALFLKETFPSALVIVLGYTMYDRFEDAVRANIHLTLYDKEGIAHARKVASAMANTLEVHLKIETGTSRQGVTLDDLSDLARDLAGNRHVKVVGVSTHFANIEDSANPQYATMQFQKFQKALEILREYGNDPELIHSACSAAIILYPQTHGTLVRAGISMYGLWSSELVQDTVRNQGISCDLRPILTWKSRIAQVKELSMGTPIGYGLSEVMKKRGRIAIIPVGYSDGYNRSLSSSAEVLVKGYRCKVLGRVCMNMLMIDVSEVPQVEKEDEVILLGTDGRHKVRAAELGGLSGTIGYEVVSRINPQLPRIIV